MDRITENEFYHVGKIILDGIHTGGFNALINDDWQRHSIIDDSPVNLLPFAYINGYKEAADMLMTHIKPYGGSIDYLVFPIFFLYRQYLELLLKRIYHNRHTPQETSKMINRNGHNIWKLFQEVESIIEDTSTKEVNRDAFQNIKDCFQNLSDYDGDSFAFRYYFNKDRNLSDTLREKITVNLKNMQMFAANMENLFYNEYNNVYS